jgi:hypothetical protein
MNLTYFPKVLLSNKKQKVFIKGGYKLLSLNGERKSQLPKLRAIGFLS